MNLDYLRPYSDQCDIESLLKIQNEKDRWKTFKGHYQEYRKILESSHESKPNQYTNHFSTDVVQIGRRDDLSNEQYEEIKSQALALRPWRKGPFSLFGIGIDSEWRSDLKWNRIKKELGSIEGETVLDIGCNNGYFLYRLAGLNPKLALGIDPTIPFYVQFHFLQKFSNISNIKFEMFGVEHLNFFKEMFDTILYMGIIYHHPDPIGQLRLVHGSLKKGGKVILETIGIPGEKDFALCPSGKYANMRNVWFVPTLSCLIGWLEKTKFKDIKIISTEYEGTKEQRTTTWCSENYKSLEDFLDPQNQELTIEGHPAPKRFCISATK